MSTIFISYSNADRELANELALRLRAAGYEALFLDFDPNDGIAAGQLWERELQHAIRRCRALIALCSKNSSSSSWSFAEILLAKTFGCEVFPVKVGPCEIVSTLYDRQAIDLTIGEEAYARLFEGLRRAGLDPRANLRWDKSRSPFPGLAAFTASDAAVFFGRELEIDNMLTELRLMARVVETTRLGVLVGASGTGKSSLLFAGVLPRVRKMDLPLVIAEPFRPRGQPLEELCVVLDSCFLHSSLKMRDKTAVKTWKRLRKRLCAERSSDKNDAQVIVDLLRRSLAAQGRLDASFLLVIDQLEEAFDSAEAHAFFTLLHRLLADSRHPLIAVATMRASSLEQFQAHAANCGLSYRLVPVDPLSRSRYAEVILRPAAMVPLSFEPGLVERIIFDAARQDALPLLAYTLQRMYRLRGRQGDEWTIEQYESVGGITGSIEQTLQTILLRPADEDVLRRFLLQLFRLDENGDWRRRPLALSEVPTEAEPLIKQLVNERLLVESADRIEVAHEALCRVWPTLHGWLEADRDFQRILLRLDAALEDWHRNTCDDGWLLQGAQVSETERWLVARREDLTCEQRSFIEASVRERDRQRDFQNQRELATATAKIHASIARRRLMVHRLIGDITKLRDVRPQLALLLAVEAAESVREDGLDPYTEQALRDALDGCAGIGMAGHEMTLSSIAVSADGRWVLTGSEDKTARLWDSAALEPWASAIVLRHPHVISAVAISPDGQRLATGDVTGLVRLWEIGANRTPREVWVSNCHERQVTHLCFSPEGSRLASGGDDAAIHVWQETVATPLRLVGHARCWIPPRMDASVIDPMLGHLRLPPPKGHLLGLSAIAWSADGKSLATGGDDGKLIMWRFGSDGAVEVRIHTGEKRPLALVCSRGGRLFAAYGDSIGSWSIDDSPGFVLSAEEKTFPLLFSSQSSPVSCIALSGTERWLAAGGGDGLAFSRNALDLAGLRMGDHGPSELALRHERLSSAAVGIGFSADSDTLAVVDCEGGVSSYGLEGQDPFLFGDTVFGHDQAYDVGKESRVIACTFANNASIVCTAGSDRTARVVEIARRGIAPRHSQVVLPGHNGFIQSFVFTGDGGRLITTAHEMGKKEVVVWALPESERLHIPPIPLLRRGDLDSIAVNSERRYLAAVDRSGRAHLWNLVSDPLGVGVALRSPDGGVRKATFSGDGRWLIASGWNGKSVYLWDLSRESASDDGEPVYTLPGEQVLCVAEKQHLIVTLTDDTVQVWDLGATPPNRRVLRPGRRQESSTYPAWASPWTFSPNGRWVVGRIDAEAFNIWDLARGARRSVWKLASRKRAGDERIIFSRNSEHLIAIYDRDGGPPEAWTLTAEGWSKRGMMLNQQWGWRVSDDVAVTSRWIMVASRREMSVHVLGFDADASRSLALYGHDDSIRHIAVSHDEQRLATGDDSGDVRLWDLTAESPSDASVILRNQCLQYSNAQPVGVTALTFAPDNRWLGVGGFQGVARLFLLEPNELIAAARRAVGRNLTQSEWKRYFPDRPYRETFPNLP